MDPYIARQPIFDSSRQVSGYELLFRSGPENYFCGIDGDVATSNLLSDAMGLHGLAELTSGKLAFVNVTENILLNQMYSVMPPGQTVIELLETVKLTDGVINACRDVRRNGYLLALDDYIGDPSFDRILAEIDILKIDFMDTSPEQRRKIADAVRRKNKTVKLLAEKVETYAEFQEAVKLGCTYLQGYFFCKPELLKGMALPGFKLSYLQFLHQVNQPELDLNELEKIIRQDVSLSFRLLKLLNSAAIGLRHRVESIKHAIVLLGDRPLRKWASLLALTNIGNDKPHELLITSLLRARFCEELGRLAGIDSRQVDLFLLGLFSVIDAIADQPLEELLNKIALDSEVSDTLTGKSTQLSPVYEFVLAFERGHWMRLSALTKALNVDDGNVGRLYQESINWAQGVLCSAPTQPVKQAS